MHTKERRIPRARRLDPPGEAPREPRPQQPASRLARRPVARPASRGPHGPVRWWERPAPDADLARWEAVQRLQAQRLQRRIPVTEVARRLRSIGEPLTRETLSRILNGKQPTTWATVRNLAEVLGVPVETPEDER